MLFSCLPHFYMGFTLNLKNLLLQDKGMLGSVLKYIYKASQVRVFNVRSYGECEFDQHTNILKLHKIFLISRWLFLSYYRHLLLFQD